VLIVVAEKTAAWWVTYSHVYRVVTTYVGCGLVTGFIGHSQFLIIIHCCAIAISHTLQFTIASTESSWSVVPSPVFWYRLAAVVVLLHLGS
jgi:hypothetical protein